MADTVFQPVITSAGVAAAIAADGGGLDLHITHIALGAAKYAPTAGQTALVDRREKAACGPGSSASATAFQVLATFSGYAGAEYDLGEIGFYAGDPDAGGILFAVASRVGERYAVRSPSIASYTADFTVNLSGVPAGSVTITVDPLAGVAAGLLAAHLAAANPHPQYSQDPIPVGAEMDFVRKTAPPGWLTACGALVSRTTYGDLWAMAQAQGLVAASDVAWAGGLWGMFGPGDGSTTFRLPDVRGEFVRVADGWRGVNQNREVGTHEFDELKAHTHTMGSEAGGGSNLATPIDSGGTDESALGNPTGSTGGTETRPRNIARLRCIKAGAPSLPAGPEPLVPDFTASSTSGSGTLNVNFTGSAAGGTPSQWSWDFGDSGTSTLQNPTHLYTAPGVYTVRLSVRSAAGVDSLRRKVGYITVT